ncbi:transposase [Alcanivorax borkumensis]|jgi:transposase|uniref:Putative truncated transposase n=1 Tax=Alcanivorax borkumensis (strain ATCC 700651 / DSM 11573 / NCIMB 13689 / SK2) TaxID=393595 RepID=Q0VTL3_ALCBS|nr:transposase [Alcanivorax borkumensis]CAL15530.1 putative truncated transposase [Alcanivorax borkumensis SK2]
MTRKRRSFTPEFKQEAAILVLDQGYTISQVSVSLGVVESALRRRVKQLEAERHGVTPKGKALPLNSGVFRSWRPAAIGWNGRRAY